MPSPFHHELEMFVKDRVDLRPSISDSPPCWKEGKGLGSLGIERGHECWPTCSSDWVCSEFDTRSIGLLISINAGTHNASHTSPVQILKGCLVEAESPNQLSEARLFDRVLTSLSDPTEFVGTGTLRRAIHSRTSRCGAF
jgi:hypothetical protein